MPREVFVYIFSSIHQVLRAEKVLKKSGLPFDLIPVPKEVNPDCGMALEIEPDRADEVTAALTKAGLVIEAVYRRRGRDFQWLPQPKPMS